MSDTDDFYVDPVAHYVAHQALFFYKPIYQKYEKLGEFLNKDLKSVVNSGLAAILTKTDFTFFQMIKDSGLSEQFDLADVPFELEKVFRHLFANEDVVYTPDHFIINGREVPHFEYNELFDHQNLLIEYVYLLVMRTRMQGIDIRTKTRTIEAKKTYSIDEAVLYTGYKKNTLYKYAQDGKVEIANAGKGTRLEFTKEALDNMMYKKEVPDVTNLL